MENKDKVMSFRDAAIEVIEANNDVVATSTKEHFLYNAGFNDGVFAMLHYIENDFVKKSKEFEEQFDKIRGLQDVIKQIRGNEEGGDSDIEDYLGGND